MARTKLAERKQSKLAELERLQNELKEIEKQEREAQRAAQKRRVEIAGKMILAIADSEDEGEAKLYRAVMELLDGKIAADEDRDLFDLDDKDLRKALGLKPRVQQPETPAA